MIREVLLSIIPNVSQVLVVIRWLLTGVGATLINQGVTTDGTWTVITGAVLAVTPLVWAAADRTLRAKLQAAAVPGVQIIVGPGAPVAAQRLAFDPAKPNIVPSLSNIQAQKPVQ